MSLADRHWPALLAATLLAIGSYFAWQWGSIAAFVAAIDHHPVFLQDFVGHYYPMGQRLLDWPRPVSGYYYSSFFALLLVPLGWLSPDGATLSWLLLQLASIAALVVASARALRLGRNGTVLLLALVLTSYPVLHNLKWGQVSVLLTAALIAAFVAHREGRPLLAGTLVGLTAAIKFYPALFALYFLLRRDARAGLAFTATVLLCFAALPAAVLGIDDWLAFEAAVRRSISLADWVTDDVNSQYVAHVLARWARLFAGIEPGDGLLAAGKAIGYAVAAGCVALSHHLLRHQPSARNDGLALAPLFLALPFLLKTSWPHYFAYLPFCQFLLARRCLADSAGPALPTLVRWLPGVSIALSSIVLFNLSPGWGMYNAWGLPFLSNLALLAAIVAIARQPSPASLPPQGSTT